MELKDLRGCVATVCLSGTVTPQFAVALSNLRSYNDRTGFHNIEYKIQHAVLVENGRDSLVRHTLEQNYDYLLQIDADAAPFDPAALQSLLQTAFIDYSHLDVVGGYCQLRGEPHLPTIDTGTGRWEEHYPGEGILPVIRTGAHFLLCKRSAFEGIVGPWFRSRQTVSPVRAMRELDSFARINYMGKNPLAQHEEWQNLLELASQQPREPVQSVGEDSSFCDLLRAHGKNIAVDTDLVVGHVTDKILLPQDFRDKMQQSLLQQKQLLGVAGTSTG